MRLHLDGLFGNDGLNNQLNLDKATVLNGLLSKGSLCCCPMIPGIFVNDIPIAMFPGDGLIP